MPELRLRRWAHTIVHYCLELTAEDILLIQTTPLATPLVEAVYEEAIKLGAQIIPYFELDSLDTLKLRYGNEQQLTTPPLHFAAAMEQATARLFIYASENVRSHSTISPARQALYAQSQRALMTKRHPKQRHCLTLFPTQAFAQEAEMSLDEFSEFVYNACFLNDDDPIASWKALGERQQRLVEFFQGKERVHITGPGTDLTLSIKDRSFVNSDGKRNFPSGEVYTGPIENSVNGEILFELPTVYQGRSVEGVRLVLREGKVIEATARRGEQFLLEMLNMDEGARTFGEMGIGTNPNINRTISEILFDEKINGTVHFALGFSLPNTGGLNRSALHWDLICDLRQGGEVRIDDELFLQNGRILHF
jgi:aminopeptidase